MKKAILYVLLTAVLLITLLTACGVKQSETITPAISETPAPASAPIEAAPVAVPDSPPPDDDKAEEGTDENNSSGNAAESETALPMETPEETPEEKIPEEDVQSLPEGYVDETEHPYEYYHPTETIYDFVKLDIDVNDSSPISFLFETFCKFDTFESDFNNFADRAIDVLKPNLNISDDDIYKKYDYDDEVDYKRGDISAYSLKTPITGTDYNLNIAMQSGWTSISINYQFEELTDSMASEISSMLENTFGIIISSKDISNIYTKLNALNAKVTKTTTNTAVQSQPTKIPDGGQSTSIGMSNDFSNYLMTVSYESYDMSKYE